jgi:hypothetical protein
MRKSKEPKPASAIALFKSPHIHAIDGRAVCFVAAEHVGAAVMLSEAVVCLPDGPTPRAHRCRTDYSALVARDPKLAISVEHEIIRMRLLTGSMLRSAITEKEPRWFELFMQSGRDLLVPLEEDEFACLALAERSTYAFGWVFEKTQCRVLREYLGPLLALPAVSRTTLPF